MRNPGYQDSSPPCWCSLHNRPFYICLIVIISVILVTALALLGFGGYYIYTNRGDWSNAYNESANESYIYEDDDYLNSGLCYLILTKLLTFLRAVTSRIFNAKDNYNTKKPSNAVSAK